jgi:hypothetical protein
MKKLVLVLCVVLVVSFAFSMESRRPTWAGWDTIVFGWPEFNAMGQMTKLSGISILGYSWRTYFDPVVRNKVNFYWEVGAQLLSVGVQAGVGLTYPLQLENLDLYLSGSINITWGVVQLRNVFRQNWLGVIPWPYPGFGVAIIF